MGATPFTGLNPNINLVPFSYLLFSNLAYDMYHNSEDSFVRKEYYQDSCEITFCGEVACIRGTMGSTHHAHITLQVYPKDQDNIFKGHEENRLLTNQGAFQAIIDIINWALHWLRNLATSNK